MLKHYASLLLLICTLVLSNASLAQCVNLQWLNPSPQGNDLEDVKFITQDSVIAVGERGAMVVSADRGQHWVALIQFTSFNLKSVWFTSPLVGYACGTLNNSGQIIKTLDGGRTWFELVSGSSQIGGASCLWFTNDSVGYCGGYSKVYKTTNRGATWTGYSFPSTYTANDIYFTSPDTGYVVAGQYVYRTTNAGLNWTQRYATGGDLFTCLDFANPDTAYAGTTSSSRPFYRSLDGGNTWAPYTSAASGVFYSVDALNFLNDTIGFATASAFNGYIYKTTNGGSTWTSVFTSAYYLDFNGIADNQLGNYTVVGDLGEMVYSSGAGAVNSWQSALQNLTYDVKAVDFIDSNIGYMASTGRIHKTLDGGETWTITNLPVSRQPTTMKFATPDTGYVFGIDGYRFRTYNAGATWINFSVNNTTGDTWGCHFLNGKVGYVCGSNGFVAKTIDAGVTWTNLTNPGNTLTLRDVYFLNESVGFVCGSNGSFFRTVDGGASWTAIPTGTTSAFFLSIEFFDNIGFVGGESGRLLKTIDGGITWTNTTAGWGDSIYDIEMISEEDGFFAIGGFNASFYRTYNGGQSWVNYGIAANDYLSDLDVLNDTTIVACGLTSAVWKVSNKVWDPPYITTVETCQGGTVHLDAPSDYDVRWVTSNYLGSFIASGADISADLFAQSDTAFVFYIDSLECMSAMRRVVVNLNENPEPPVLVAANTTFCEGENITVLSADESIIEWSTGEVANAIMVDSSQAVFARKLENGCYSNYSDTLLLTVNPRPYAPIVTLEDYNPCSPASLSLQSDNESTIWSLFVEEIEQGGTGANFTTPVIGESTTIRASVLNEFGCVSNSVVVPVDFHIITLTPTVEQSWVPVCANGSVTLGATEFPGYELLWSTGDIGPSVSVDQPGSYSVRYAANGCEGLYSSEIQVELITVLAPTLEASTLEICEGDTVVLSSSSPVFWSNGEFGSAIEVTSEGSYSAYSESLGCYSPSSSALYVTVHSLPLPLSPYTLDYNACEVSDVTLTTMEGVNAFWYSNASGEALYQGESYLVENLSDTASYFVRAISDQGCIGELSEIEIPVSLAPAAPVLSAATVSFCDGGSALVNATYTGNIVWSTGATTPSVEVFESSFVSAVATEGNCSSALSNVISIEALPVPNAPLVSASNTELCEGEFATIEAIAEGEVLWSTGETGNTISVGTSTSVTAIAVQGLCQSTSSNTVEIVVIPTPITPSISLSGTNMLVATPSGADYYVWFDGNSQINTTSNTLEVPNVDAIYTVIAFVNGCPSAQSEAFQYISSNVSEVLDEEMSVWPNPSNAEVNIKCSEPVQSYTVYSTTGEIVLSCKSMSKSFVVLPVSSIANGLYMVKIQTQSGVELQVPFVVAH